MLSNMSSVKMSNKRYESFFFVNDEYSNTFKHAMMHCFIMFYQKDCLNYIFAPYLFITR